MELYVESCVSRRWIISMLKALRYIYTLCAFTVYLTYITYLRDAADAGADVSLLSTGNAAVYF